MHRRAAMPILSLLALFGCGDPEAPETLDAVGTYTATTFTTEEAGVATDRLALGASITLTLRADGTTEGRLFVPGAAEDGSDFDADLAGTWRLAGTIVTLAHETDTFIRDIPFSADGTRLAGEETLGTVTFRIVLSK